MKTNENFPKVTYRLVTGRGYFNCGSKEEDFKKIVEERRKFAEEYGEQFAPHYGIKVTEEYINI